MLWVRWSVSVETLCQLPAISQNHWFHIITFMPSSTSLQTSACSIGYSVLDAWKPLPFLTFALAVTSELFFYSYPCFRLSSHLSFFSKRFHTPLTLYLNLLLADQPPLYRPENQTFKGHPLLNIKVSLNPVLHKLPFYFSLPMSWP